MSAAVERALPVRVLLPPPCRPQHCWGVSAVYIVNGHAFLFLHRSPGHAFPAEPPAFFLPFRRLLMIVLSYRIEYFHCIVFGLLNY